MRARRESAHGPECLVVPCAFVGVLHRAEPSVEQLEVLEGDAGRGQLHIEEVVNRVGAACVAHLLAHTLEDLRRAPAVASLRGEEALPSSVRRAAALLQQFGEALQYSRGHRVQLIQRDEAVPVAVHRLPQLSRVPFVAHAVARPAEVEEGEAAMLPGVEFSPRANHGAVPGDELLPELVPHLVEMSFSLRRADVRQGRC
mmetsp:Transcript_71923/g.161014  ORF Transcript_71923/g.161014 Transcript_71923/m.161014 type:complete len:200 (-) Transcript_71923:189-788(-)